METRPKILYVDDEEINLQIFELYFEDKYEIHTAEDGIQALDILDRHVDINIVVSDMRMPIMNGIEFIEKAKIKYPNVNYFILSGYELNQELRDALERNLISNYFKKPLDVDEIELAFSNAVNP